MLQKQSFQAMQASASNPHPLSYPRKRMQGEQHFLLQCNNRRCSICAGDTGMTIPPKVTKPSTPRRLQHRVPRFP